MSDYCRWRHKAVTQEDCGRCRLRLEADPDFCLPGEAGLGGWDACRAKHIEVHREFAVKADWPDGSRASALVQAPSTLAAIWFAAQKALEQGFVNVTEPPAHVSAEVRSE